MSLSTTKETKFPLVKLIRKQVLNFSSISDNHNKFYVAEHWEGNGGHCIKTDYGRVNVTSTVDYRYGSDYECAREFDRLIASKIKKGYRLVETEDIAETKTAPAIIVKTAETKTDVPPNILKLIEYMFGQTTTYVQKTCQTPVGKLSKAQIIKGKTILEEIENLLETVPDFANVNSDLSLVQKEKIIVKSGKRGKLEDLCSEYYSSIPQKLSRDLRGFENLIKDGDDLAKQEDLLQALEDLLGVQDVAVSDDLMAKYNAFEAKFDLPDSDIKKRIEKWFNVSKSKHHNMSMTIHDIITVKRDEDFKRWDEDIAKIKTQEVFHGTRNQNVLGICSRGLMLPGQHSSAKNGAAFGAGIYGALHSSKSAQYCGDGWRSSGNQYMFVLDLAVGKQYIHKGWVSGGWKPIPKDCHSTWAQSGDHGGSLLHDELIVYKNSQARLTHIINFSSKW